LTPADVARCRYCAFGWWERCCSLFSRAASAGELHSFPTRRSSDLSSRSRSATSDFPEAMPPVSAMSCMATSLEARASVPAMDARSEEHTSELQSRENLVCRLLLEKIDNQYHWPSPLRPPVAGLSPP